MQPEAKFYPKKAHFESKHQSIPNSLVFHRGMSADAKLLIIALNGIHSATPNWIPIQSDLAKRLGFGRNKMRNAIKQCVEFGYLRVRQGKTKKGVFSINEFEYDTEPSFLNQQNEETPNFQPTHTFEPSTENVHTAHIHYEPSTYLPSTVAVPLPKPVFTMPVHRTKKALPNTESVCQPPPLPDPSPQAPTSKGTDKAMPFFARQKALDKSAPKAALLKPGLGSQRKYPRSAAHEECFQWLLTLHLTDEHGKININEMSYLSHAYTRQQLEDAYCHLQYKMASTNFKPKSYIAVFKYFLKNEGSLKGSTTLERIKINKEFAEIFRQENKWWSLIVKEEYVCDCSYSGKDLSLTMNPDDFADALQQFYDCLQSIS